MGYCKPLYGTETIMQKVENISKIDEKINILMLEREKECEALKEEIEKFNTSKN